MEIYNKIMAKVEETLNDLNGKNKFSEKEEEADGPLESVCLLFPTYATRNAEGNKKKK
jgi:hypothetical protein